MVVKTSYSARGPPRGSHVASVSDAGIDGLDAGRLSTGESDDQQADDRVVLAQRLWNKNELIKQLKQIVQAQHLKIEELREKVDMFTAPTVRMFNTGMQEESRAALDLQEIQDLRRRVAELSHNVANLKKENVNLHRTNKRLKGMIRQMGQPALATPAPPNAEAPVGEVAADGAPRAQSPPALLDVPTDVVVRPAEPPGSSRPSQPASPPPPTAKGSIERTQGSPSKSLPSCAKQRLLSSIPLFWRDLTSSTKILSSLFPVAERILSSDGTVATLTVYIVDDWLKASCAQEHSEPLTQYNVDGGKITMYALQHRRDKKTEVPIFADVLSLPYQNANSMAFAVQMPGSHRRVAALQATRVMEGKTTISAADASVMPKVLQRTGLVKPAEPDFVESKSRGFSDWHRVALQLACHVLGGVLEQHEARSRQVEELKKVKGAVNVAVALSKASSLKDFELETTTLLANFFNVSRARMFFYSAESEELFITSPILRRKGFCKASIHEGIVGLCARRRQPIHVSDTLYHPYFSGEVDLQQATSEKRLKKNTAMLCAPLMLDTTEKGAGEAQLLGVVQLLERKRQSGSDATGFTEEEEVLFERLLEISSHVLWRLYKAEEAAAKLSGQPSDLEQLLVV
mmetsp:Transcript_9792/g.17706  ORF Transcript_9792/g.17706 Transcript_9792/m.17706 type:complete len:630 (-) Transcript_9792:24-1913(-)